LLSNCLLKHINEGKTGRGIEVMRRKGRRCKQLQDDFREMRGYWKLKEDTLNHTVWRTCLGRGYGLVIK
jgi:hypothetical protein